MKKNLTKLALSGAALAAVAATLGTSTYAWYTTNPTVNANNIIGASSDTGSSSIYISLDHENWSSVVDLTNVSLSTALVPVQYASAGKFTKINPATGAATVAADGGADVAKFTLYFKSSKVADDNAQSIYLKSFSLANTTTAANLKPADNLLYTGTAGTNAGVDTSKNGYYVDFRKALALGINNVDYRTVTVADADAFNSKKASLYVKDDQNNYVSQATATYAAGATYYENKGYDGAMTLNDNLKFDATNTTYAVPAGKHEVSQAKAHEYYDAVMPTHLANDAVKTVASAYNAAAIGVCPTNGTSYITVDFYVYLDGGSGWCYDACQGQTFKLNLQFTSVAGEAYNHN